MSVIVNFGDLTGGCGCGLPRTDPYHSCKLLFIEVFETINELSLKGRSWVAVRAALAEVRDCIPEVSNEKAFNDSITASEADYVDGLYQGVVVGVITMITIYMLMSTGT